MLQSTNVFNTRDLLLLRVSKIKRFLFLNQLALLSAYLSNEIKTSKRQQHVSILDKRDQKGR